MAQTTNEQLLEKTDQILRVLVSMATRDMNQREQIAFLNTSGFQPKAIADLIGTTGNNVRVTLTSLRKSRGKKKGKKSGSRS